MRILFLKGPLRIKLFLLSSETSFLVERKVLFSTPLHLHCLLYIRRNNILERGVKNSPRTWELTSTPFTKYNMVVVKIGFSSARYTRPERHVLCKYEVVSKKKCVDSLPIVLESISFTHRSSSFVRRHGTFD